MQNSGLYRPSGPQIKNKRKQKRNKYLDLARELKKQWNMEVTVISTVTDGLGSISKVLVKRQET